jgi:hypothetical protein
MSIRKSDKELERSPRGRRHVIAHLKIEIEKLNKEISRQDSVIQLAETAIMSGDCFETYENQLQEGDLI